VAACVETHSRACYVQEMFKTAGQHLSSELDDVTPCLLRKAGEMSTAGRDNFLGQYADVALSQMVLSCPETAVAKSLMAMYVHSTSVVLQCVVLQL
jgi:hypothetical protein